MKIRVAHLALVLGLAGAVSVGCGSDDDSSTNPKGGAGGVAGSSGKAGSAGKGGSSGKGGSIGNAGTGNEGGMAGEGVAGASAGTDQGGGAGAGGDRGENAGSGPGGEGGGAGAGEIHVYTEAQVARGQVIVNSLALCGGCHTGTGGALGGNPNFAKGVTPAPNLTDDATGIGEWTDAQVITAFRDGIDDEGRHLNPIMPYWLFHNMTDADAKSVVAYLRSVPHVAAEVGAANPAGTPVTPLAPTSLPDTTLPSTAPEYAKAQQGKYLVSAIAQCVKCHSPAPAPGQPPVASFFTGVPPTAQTLIFASNITPDATTGIGGWTAEDVKTALKVGTNKAGVTLCGAMPSAAKGYGGMSDEDAQAIGIYLTTIPAVSSPTTAPSLEGACPVNP